MEYYSFYWRAVFFHFLGGFLVQNFWEVLWESAVGGSGRGSCFWMALWVVTILLNANDEIIRICE